MGCRCPPQLGYDYPFSFSAITFPFQYYYSSRSVLLPPQLSEYVVRRRNRSCTSFRAFLLLSQVSSMYYWVRDLMAPSLQVDITPRVCDFLEELVVGDGVKPLGLHLRATCRGVVLLIFGSIYLRSHITVYTDSLILSR